MTYEEDLNKVFGGKTIKENLQWVIARNNTGYTYQELLNGDEEELELDVDDELKSIDETVNLLLHLYKHTKEANL